jgi:hypothetical protein
MDSNQRERDRVARAWRRRGRGGLWGRRDGGLHHHRVDVVVGVVRRVVVLVGHVVVLVVVLDLGDRRWG